MWARRGLRPPRQRVRGFLEKERNGGAGTVYSRVHTRERVRVQDPDTQPVLGAALPASSMRSYSPRRLIPRRRAASILLPPARWSASVR